MFRSTIGPVRRPLAVALDDIDKLPSDDTVSLLTGVQFVVPQERVWASGVPSAIHVGIASDIEWRSTVEVVGGVVVNIRQLLEPLLAYWRLKDMATRHLPVH